VQYSNCQCSNRSILTLFQLACASTSPIQYAAALSLCQCQVLFRSQLVSAGHVIIQLTVEQFSGGSGGLTASAATRPAALTAYATPATTLHSVVPAAATHNTFSHHFHNLRAIGSDWVKNECRAPMAHYSSSKSSIFVSVESAYAASY